MHEKSVTLNKKRDQVTLKTDCHCYHELGQHTLSSQQVWTNLIYAFPHVIFTDDSELWRMKCTTKTGDQEGNFRSSNTRSLNGSWHFL